MNLNKSYTISNAESFKILKKEADLSNRNRTLRKLHSSHEEELHTMINVLKKGTYICPHKHTIRTSEGKTIRKGESFLALEGEGLILLFKDNGEISDKIYLKENEKTMVWIPANVYHTIVALTDYFILFENKTGPWKEEEDKFFHPKFPTENENFEHIVKEWEIK